MEIQSRKASKPNHHDWNTVKRLIRYLYGIADLKLKLPAFDKPKLTGYMDVNWARDKTDNRSLSGHLFSCRESLINWTSQKQSLIAQSTADAEYASASGACGELEWIVHLLKDLGTEEHVVPFTF